MLNINKNNDYSDIGPIMDEEYQTMFERSDEEFDALLLETKVKYNKVLKYVKHAQKELFDGFEIDPTEYAPTSAMQRLSDVISHMDEFFVNVTLYDKE